MKLSWVTFRYRGTVSSTCSPWRLRAASMQVSAKWRYAQLQVDNGTAPERRVVSAEMMVELHRPEIAVGADWPSTRLQSLHYSLGRFTGEDHCVHLVYHNGANPGFRATIVLVPSSKT